MTVDNRAICYFFIYNHLLVTVVREFIEQDQDIKTNQIKSLTNVLLGLTLGSMQRGQ